MAITYVIVVDKLTHYVPVNMSDTKATMMWEKAESGLVYKKTLGGTFTFNRSGNEDLYDDILNMDFCDICYIIAYFDGDLMVTSVFGKTDIDYNEDKCLISIKPRYYEPYYMCVGANGDKDYNIINYLLPTYSVKYTAFRNFEFKTCTGHKMYLFRFSEFPSWVVLGWDGSSWIEFFETDNVPNLKVTCFPATGDAIQHLDSGWTFYSQKNTNIIITPDFDGRMMNFDCTTIWFREVKLVPKSDTSTQGVPPPDDTSIYPWIYIGEETLNDYVYHKWVRCVDNLVVQQTETSSYSWWYLTSYLGWYDPILSASTDRVLTRCRKLTDVLNYFAENCGCTLVSQFFTNNVNPVSGVDLTNLMIAQKSDCRYEIVPPAVIPTLHSDPATIGNITFNQLMEHLQSMFQVYWYINDASEMVVEHIRYFRYNLSYVPNTTVGIDLNVIYPMCLYGTKAYSYNKNIPQREKFSFMEAWNLDFRGTDIEYPCITDGSTESHSANMITTDIDPLYLDYDTSDEGFCLFHCSPVIGGTVDYLVIKEIGELSGLEIANNHLSWANLHHYYWMDNRPIGSGVMNNKPTVFTLNRKLQNQVKIEFPYCPNIFDPNELIGTTLGIGEVKEAEYSFKTGNIVIQLIYE
jgi:hypothetical protein